MNPLLSWHRRLRRVQSRGYGANRHEPQPLERDDMAKGGKGGIPVQNSPNSPGSGKPGKGAGKGDKDGPKDRDNDDC